MSIEIIILLAGFLGTAASGFVFYRLGRRHGFSHGEAEEWVRQYFRQVQADRERRDKLGRFAKWEGKK
jgi:hypothetical protein